MKVIWTQRALKSYLKVADYLQEEWGNTVVANFTNEVESVITNITLTPAMFEASSKYSNVRRGYITEHNTLFYKVKPRTKEIELLVFWDNRKDPKKSPY